VVVDHRSVRAAAFAVVVALGVQEFQLDFVVSTAVMELQIPSTASSTGRTSSIANSGLLVSTFV
jgi:hypothetical protein